VSGKNRFNGYWLMRIALVLWLVSSALVLFLLSRIDSIVHGALYNYGLQFSFAWADPYWNALHMIYVFLAIPIVVSGAALVSSFWRRGDERRVSTSVVSKPSGSAVQSSRENHMLASCPSCKKVFSKPLIMLDFGGGKTRLVNVCPYCNHVLGDAEEGERDRDEVAVRDLEEEVEE
jgi:uncharacterized Zn-finger protein